MTASTTVPTHPSRARLVPVPSGGRGRKALPAIVTAARPLGIDEAFALYGEYLVRTGASPHTQTNWRTRSRVFQAWCAEQGFASAEEVEAEDLELYLADLRTRPTAYGRPGYATRTIEGHHRMVRALFTYLHKRRYLRENPAELLEPPKVAAKDHPILLPEDVAKLLAACEGRLNPLRSKALILFLWDLGCRFEEMALLTLGDVNWTNGVVKFRAETTKTDEDRVNRLSPEALDALLEYVEQERPAPDRRVRDWQDWLFLSESGRRLQNDSSNSVLRRLGQRAGLPMKVTHHLFRHSHVTVRLAFELASGEHVSYDVGHRSRTTTAKYTHLAEAFRRSGFKDSGLASLIPLKRGPGRPKKGHHSQTAERPILPRPGRGSE